ncbi:hypothetical protein SAMN05216428_12310 [Nitrosospira sp. Nsp11]|uniref:hypothetical protein n=1 Tax=Nitrosospira sp. Nsp11 TaxID=1855338 RepID=UPI0009216334|nr:hypothetical protein [Nitrosospira sp. Nsp11]SHM30359.1 hypothetical protein SAMN05216428_12310 [Nitrosospira sp. Nsp11]
MSVFRDTVGGRRGQEIYIILSGKPNKVKIERVTDDMVTLTMLEDGALFKEFFIHIDNLIIVSKKI